MFVCQVHALSEISKSHFENFSKTRLPRMPLRTLAPRLVMFVCMPSPCAFCSFFSFLPRSRASTCTWCTKKCVQGAKQHRAKGVGELECLASKHLTSHSPGSKYVCVCEMCLCWRTDGIRARVRVHALIRTHIHTNTHHM